MLSAELLKLRKRWASYVVLAILLGLMVLVFLLVGAAGGGDDEGFDPSAAFFRFPGAYGVLNQFIFGLGSLLAVSYAAAIAGADWNWGVFRVVVARGESRTRYILVKALAVAIALLIGMLIAFLVGIALVFMAAAIAGRSAGDPIGGQSGQDLLESTALGFPVIVERAAIGFAVATVLRSQVAGIVSGIVLLIGESILSAILFVTMFASRFAEGPGEPIGTQWFQYLPFSIGDSVLAAAPSTGGGGGPETLLGTVPLVPAMIATLVYLVVAIVIAVIVAERREIVS
jgi:ABC-type transport system involved in multi-copper enzyme maturation permease subunit